MALARRHAGKVILATNLIFPPNGVATRLSWLGLKPADFDFVTSYENSRFCKPNPHYYQEILLSQGLQAENCLMIGNDVDEDVIAAGQAEYEVIWCWTGSSTKVRRRSPHRMAALQKCLLI